MNVPNTSMVHWKKPEATAAAVPRINALKATSQSSEYPTQFTTATVAFDFPSTRERYRNLTRAVEYSVVVDCDNEISQDSTFYERISTTPLEHLLHHPQRKSSDGIQTFDQEDSQVAFARTVSKRFVKRMAFLSLWWQWLVRKAITARVGKQLRKLFPIPVRNRNSSSSDKGFQYTGGTKRHYALLVACLVKGDIYHQPAVLWPQNDPLAYHRSIVESDHRRTIASLSPSTLSFSSRRNSSIHVSALERHALKWALNQQHHQGRAQNKKQQQQE